MNFSTGVDSHSPASSGRKITQTAAGPDNGTAPPAITSGFGAVMEQEHDLQSSTQGYLGAVKGPHSRAIDHILRQQQVRLGANIALLEQRYEMLPHPLRFQALHESPTPLTKAGHVAADPESIGLLPHLVAQHLHVLEDIDTLIAHAPDGQRGELILTEVARNHEEMAWVLTALLKEDESVRDLDPIPVTPAAPAAPTRGTSEGGWENEGGAPLSPPAPDAPASQRVA